MKKVFLYDNSSYFVGECFAQIDPLETKAAGYEIYINPANSTEIDPPPKKDGFKIKWNGEKWEYDEIQTKKEEQQEKTPEYERISELICYLYDTDWYAIRYAETSVEIPEEIRKARQAAREEISALRCDEDVKK